MDKKTENNAYKVIKKNILLAIPVVFLVSPLLHFLYEITGDSILVASFVPVNESIWEHFKLGTIPIMLWWLISYFIIKKKISIDIKRWVIAACVSITLIPLVIGTFFYSYTGAFGIESIVLDIFSLLLALVVSQLISLHVYKYIKVDNKVFYLSIIVILVIIVVTVIFTFYPYHIPMLKDGVTGTYGIK